MDSPLQFHGQPARSKTPCIGVFDSGVGGLSVLRSLRSQLPHAPLLYVADSAHAPYGERSDEYVLDRSRRIMDHVLAEGSGVAITAQPCSGLARFIEEGDLASSRLRDAIDQHTRFF